MPRIKKNVKQNRRGVPSAAPARAQSKRRGVPSGAPARADRSKDPSLQGAPAESGGFENPPLHKDGLSEQAFAIVPDMKFADSWQLPHHTQQVLKDVEGSVDWMLVEKATQLLSLQGDEGRRVSADPALIIDAARHIAGHYHNAGRSIPTALCVLI